jgi:uncharacterized protein (UPF0261 family)
MQKRAVAVVATLDTKGPEAGFVVERIKAGGCDAVVLDTGIMAERDPAAPTPTFTPGQIAAEAGEDRDELAAKLTDKETRDRWIRAMAAGSAKLLKRLQAEGKIHGAIGLGGAQGTEICSTAMRALPLGVPKLLVSTVASGRTPFGIYTGTRDLTMMHSVVDVLGINSLTRLVLTNAVGAVVGMVDAQAAMEPEPAPRVRIGISIYGNTTPAAMAVKGQLERLGYEVFGFHSNGTGGLAMEELAAEDMLDVILDLSTHELTDEIFGGIHGGDENRLVRGGRKVPRLVVPGALDLITFGRLEDVPARFHPQQFVRHNPNVTLVRTNTEQLIRLGEVMGERLNRAEHPVEVIVPIGGWSFYNRDGLHFRDIEADQAFVDTLRRTLRPDIPVRVVNMHVNDPEFAEHLVKEFERFWHKGPARTAAAHAQEAHR